MSRFTQGGNINDLEFESEFLTLNLNLHITHILVLTPEHEYISVSDSPLVEYEPKFIIVQGSLMCFVL